MRNAVYTLFFSNGFGYAVHSQRDTSHILTSIYPATFISSIHVLVGDLLMQIQASLAKLIKLNNNVI